MRLALTLEERSCEQVRTERGVAGAPAECPGTAAPIGLLCAPDDDGLLRCRAETGELPPAATGLPWVFREGGCVEQSGGRPFEGPLTYADCPPARD